ncbi:MAG: SGNH/GDSL hydrolase family protein [Brevinematales bacterium]
MQKKVLYTVFFLFFWVVLFLMIEACFRLVGMGYSTEPFERVVGTPYYRDNPDFLNKYYPSRRTPRSEAKFKNLFLVEKPTNGLRIFIVGGSTAQGWPFEPNQSFGKMIQAALERILPEKEVEVINLGYSAMSSYYVADVMKKLFRYQPDVILLYTGQNEYYGTISATTGGGYFAQCLYLALREWRIFQVLFGFFERKKNSSQTMMAAQFAGHHVPPGEVDKRVAKAFERNLSFVFDEAKKGGVNVVVYEMAANLIHMPPFASMDEEIVSPLILSNQMRFRHETWKTEETKRLLDTWRDQFPSNAHVWYLTGIARRTKGEEFLSSLRLAKDLDVIPFRYRETLREVLHQVVREKKVVFIPLQEEIERRFGPDGFGRLLFVDHLHFQYRGQVFLAELGTKAILSFVFPERVKEVDRLFDEVYEGINRASEGGLAHENWLDATLFFTVYDEFMAIQNILALVSQSPYKEMLIPFVKDPSWGRIGMVFQEPFKTILASYEMTKGQAFGNFLLSELAKQKRWDIIVNLLEAYCHNNRGWYVGYKNCGDFYLSRGGVDEALRFYAMAYLLAERKEKVTLRKDVEKIVKTAGKEKEWENLLKWLAKNPWFGYNTSE